MHYKFDLHEDVMIGYFGEQTLLIDTGAPMSFSNAPIEINDSTHAVASSYLGHDAEYFSEKIKRRIDGFIGIDILNVYDFCVDYAKQTITFSDKPISTKSKAINMAGMSGMPYIVILECGGRQYKCYLDSGATITYLDDKAVSGQKLIEHYQDFNPILGDFSTDLYRCTPSVAGYKFSARVGRLPNTASTLLSMFGVDGVLGVDFFKAYKVTFSPRESKLYLDPHDIADSLIKKAPVDGANEYHQPLETKEQHHA